MKSLVVAQGCLLVLFAVGHASNARADGYRLDRFRAAERADDAFATRRMGPMEHLRLGANVVADYANDPLRVDTVVNGKKTGERSVVSDQLMLKVDVSLALWSRVLFFAGFEATTWMQGESLPNPADEADSAGFGALSLGSRLRLFGDPSDLFAFGAQGTVILPMSGDSNYLGESGVAFRPELIVEVRPKYLRLTANAGTVLKADKAELAFAGALGVPVHRRVELIGELHGGVFDPLPRTGNGLGLEFLLGGKANAESGLYFGVGAGASLLAAIGNPDFRLVGQFGYVRPLNAKAAPEAKKPAQAQAALDSDGDGVPDSQDRCFRDPEDRDGVSDEDGCPDADADADADADGVLDVRDKCPREAEDKDGFADEDGCPETDNDADAVVDADDRCPDEPEDRDGLADEDGCAEQDADGDGVLDPEDRCPSDVGAAEAHGCQPQVAVSSQGEITIRDEILFEPGKDRFAASSQGTLDAVRIALSKRGTIKRVRIEGHTDTSGSPHLNRKLSQARARAVTAWLIDHGIDKARLTAVGCASEHPIADNSTEEGRARNRRVVFQVTQPVPSEKERVAIPAKCIVVEAVPKDADKPSHDKPADPSAPATPSPPP